MDYKQCYTVLNESVSQFLGEEEVASTDLTGLVSMGLTVISDLGEAGISDFLRGMVDRVYRIVTGVREYTPQADNILVDSATYGAMLEKIYIEPTDAQENKSYSLQNGQTVDPFIVSLPKTNVKVFSNMDVWEIPYTITKKMLMSKFVNENEYMTFVAFLELQIRNSFELAVQNTKRWTINNFIAKKVEYSKEDTAKGVHVVNLLAEYNTLTNTSLTVDNCYTNADFLRYCTNRMNVLKSKMSEYTRVFNTEQFARFTRPEDLRIDVQSDFAQACQSYLQSDVYHNELVALPTYHEVAFWQGSGTDFDRAECQKIDIVTSDQKTVTVNGVVAFFHDIDALGVTIWDKTTTSQYNGRGEYTNFWNKANIGLFNDLSENAIVFIIANA